MYSTFLGSCSLVHLVLLLYMAAATPHLYHNGHHRQVVLDDSVDSR